MIRRITIESFGSLTGRSFELEATTILLGANEAGKTTFFDALFQGLCNPTATRRHGRRLRERYGEHRLVHLEWLDGAGAPRANAPARNAGGTPKSRGAHFDEEEFLSLFAVRSGSFEMALEESTAWVRRLKSALLSGGVDPGALARRFEALASPQGARRHNRRLSELESETERLELTLAGLGRRREELAVLEEQLHRDEEAKEELERLCRAAEAEHERLAQGLALRQGLTEKQALQGRLARLERGREIEGEMASLGGGEPDDPAALAALERRLEELGRSAAAADSAVQLLERSGSRKQGELSAAEAELARTQGLSNLATVLLEQLGVDRTESRPQPGGLAVQAPPRRWRRGLLLAALGVFLAGLVGGVLAPMPRWQIALAAAGLGAATILILSARRHLGPTGPGGVFDREALLEAVRDRWLTGAGASAGTAGAVTPPRAAASDPGPAAGGTGQPTADSRPESGIAGIHRHPPAALEARTREGMIQELQSHRSAHLFALRRAAELRAEVEALRIELQDARERREDMRRQNERAGQQLRRWLEQRGAANRDLYLGRRSRLRTLQEEHRRWREEVQGWLREAPAENVAGLGRLFTARLRELERQAPPAAPLSPAELRTLERRTAEAAAALADLKSRHEALARSCERSRGEVEGSAGSLPEEILQAEGHLEARRSEIRTLLLDRDAAAMLRELFGRIAAADEVSFGKLAETLSSHYSRLLPQLRSVRIDGLNLEAMGAADAGGTVRPLEQLSGGTREAFLLAARLALAELHHPGPAVLVLDEPFLSLDPERTRRALEAVREVQERRAWQVILLTKDPELARQGQAVLAGSRVIAL